MPGRLIVECTYKVPEGNILDYATRENAFNNLLEKLKLSPYYAELHSILVEDLASAGNHEAKWKIDWPIVPTDTGECSYASHLEKVHKALDKSFRWNLYVAEVVNL